MAAAAGPLIVRSLLFAPANEPRKTGRLGRSGADAVVLDLEDAVADDKKVAARGAAAEALAALAAERAAAGGRGPLACVRVNAFDTGLTADDIRAVTRPDLDLVVLPKVETARDVQRAAALLEAAEIGRGLEPGRIRILALVETCAGIAEGAAICAAGGRLAAVGFGSGDLGKDIGIPTLRGDLSAAIAYGRGKIVYDARAAGLPRPIDGPHLAVRDLDGLEADCRAARALGHGGKVCIHPDQVPAANRIFAPDPDEVAFARQVIDAFAEAEARGSAAIEVGGVFIDYPIVLKARSIVALADAIAARQVPQSGAAG